MSAVTNSVSAPCVGVSPVTSFLSVATGLEQVPDDSISAVSYSAASAVVEFVHARGTLLVAVWACMSGQWETCEGWYLYGEERNGGGGYLCHGDLHRVQRQIGSDGLGYRHTHAALFTAVTLRA